MKRTRMLVLVGSTAVLASGLGGWAAAGRRAGAADRGGVLAHVTRVAHAGAGTGVHAMAADGHTLELAEGAAVPCGSTLVTDPRTRVRLELADGTILALDRDTRVKYASSGTPEVVLASGSLVVDLGPAASLVAHSPVVEVSARGARYALTVEDGRASVGVARGDVVMRGPHDDVTVHPGEEAEVASGAFHPEITATADLGQRIAFGESFDRDGERDPNERTPAGLGEMRARKPGSSSSDEIDGAVRLARHQVKARIAGAMARTEIDETFVNTTDRELEGIWRFPLPQGARLERLSLEVDGKLVEGEFVDARRAAGIWRGVLQQATPFAPKPVEEIVWVPGPWRDPALLEWQRSGQAELKVFPIPRRGSRRVVLAYTQHVEPAGGLRRYVVPLAAHAGAAPIDEVRFDVRVVGGDPSVPVRVRGYDLAPIASASGEAPEAASFTLSRTAFTPSGDLVVEYATADRATEVSTVAFTSPDAQEGTFVALALRPRLPPRIAERNRDQVIVVDTGRTMFGERLRRASRLAVELAQQMDRRDRVTVLACDLECRAMPGEWHPPGAASAHDVDAFLAGIEADGATDLVEALRSASAIAGRAADHDLRVVLLSDGLSTAGVRDLTRLAATVGAQVADPRAQVVAVPIGSDADVDTLSEIARGGGGTIVPYGAGQALEAAALDVLSATYGATLRDVALTLPDGLHDVAPLALPPLRAGAETLLSARMKGNHVSGDVVLRGNLAGEPFEARWPVDVNASSDEGNAWTARAWAAGRIAEDERAGDEPARAEAVALSHRFRVPSRHTSLLVLESEAMFHAFGVSRAVPAFAWTGESESRGSDVAPAPDPMDIEKSAALVPSGAGASRGALSTGPAAFDDAAIPKKVARPQDAPPAATWAPPPPSLNERPAPLARGGRWMRRVWFRTASITGDERSPIGPGTLEAARAALAASPDLRQRHAELARLLLRAGLMTELQSVTDRWAARDPLDPDMLAARAAARAWRGDRDGALRILSGALASPGASSAVQAEMASALAVAEERAHKPALACALRIAAAESRPEAVDAVAAAVACQRGRGDEASAALWLAQAKDGATRVRISSGAARLLASPRGEDAVFGDVAVDASWDEGAGVDLDVAILDPKGRRLSWASSAGRVRARDCTSRSHEALGVSSGGAGAFVVEIVRADGPSGSPPPVRGKLRVSALGRTQLVPFVLVGQRAAVARVDVRFDSRLEPVSVLPAW